MREWTGDGGTWAEKAFNRRERREKLENAEKSGEIAEKIANSFRRLQQGSSSSPC